MTYKLSKLWLLWSNHNHPLFYPTQIWIVHHSSKKGKANDCNFHMLNIKVQRLKTYTSRVRQKREGKETVPASKQLPEYSSIGINICLFGICLFDICLFGQGSLTFVELLKQTWNKHTYIQNINQKRKKKDLFGGSITKVFGSYGCVTNSFRKV